MALISTEDFRGMFDIDSDIENPRVELHIGSASRRLRGWVGAEKYAAAVAAASDDDATDADVEMLADLRNAEGHLAMHFAILGLNSPIARKGVVATAVSDEGRETRKYLTPDETAKLSTQYLELAREIADPYVDGTEGNGIVVVRGCGRN